MKKSKLLLCLCGVSALLLGGKLALKKDIVDAAEESDATSSEVKTLFEKYYHKGYYVKDSVINLTEKAQNEASEYFHAGANALKRRTFYYGDSLWMTNDEGTINSGYGTSGNGKLTHFKKDSVSPTEPVVANGVETEIASLPGMEAYYVTLNDFKEGTHTSDHTNGATLDLTQDWTVEDGVYTSTNADVIDAFRLFTAPLWIGKTAANENYIPFTKATVEEINNQLVMKLYVSPTEYSANEDEGKITDENGVFSQATINACELVSEELESHNFTDNGTTSSFYTITKGNLSTSKGTATYNGEELTQCLKMESSTNISFSTTAKSKLTLVFASTESNKKVNIDGVACTTDSNAIVTVDLAAGDHTITKVDGINLFYISLGEEKIVRITEELEEPEQGGDTDDNGDSSGNQGGDNENIESVEFDSSSFAGLLILESTTFDVTGFSAMESFPTSLKNKIVLIPVSSSSGTLTITCGTDRTDRAAYLLTSIGTKSEQSFNMSKTGDGKTFDSSNLIEIDGQYYIGVTSSDDFKITIYSVSYN